MADKQWWAMRSEEQQQEFPGIRREDLATLRAWLGKQPHLPPLSDEQLGVFLAACMYSIEGAKRAIEINYTIRTRHPRIFANRNIDLPELENAKKYMLMGFLPRKKERPVTMAYRICQMDSSLYDLELFLRASYMLQDVSNLRLGPAPEGYNFIIDMKHWTLGHILRSPLNICAVFLKYAQEGSCCRINQLHFMNAGPVLEKFLSMIKPFISPEVWKLIFLHEKTEGLEKYLDAEEIPKDFDGGKAKSLEELSEEGLRLLRAHSEWFEAEAALRVDEAKRPPGSKSPLEDSGLQGSFRKLDID